MRVLHLYTPPIEHSLKFDLHELSKHLNGLFSEQPVFYTSKHKYPFDTHWPLKHLIGLAYGHYSHSD